MSALSWRANRSAAVYVALGDSISIDEYAGGRGRGGASLLVTNRDEDFPEWRGRDLGGVPWWLLAQDGGTTDTVLGDQLPLLEKRAAAPTYVTMTVGGNDLLGCYGDTAAATRVIATVGRRVGEVLDRLRELGPGARVAVGTVYDPSDGTGDAASVGLPPWPDVVDLIGELNTTLTEVALQHGATVADIHGRFLGHGLSRGNPAQPMARPGDRDLWFCQVIEPNAWGAGAVRAAFWDALGLSGRRHAR
jgi:lysophospholipase L1-like esterase